MTCCTKSCRNWTAASRRALDPMRLNAIVFTILQIGCILPSACLSFCPWACDLLLCILSKRGFGRKCVPFRHLQQRRHLSPCCLGVPPLPRVRLPHPRLRSHLHRPHLPLCPHRRFSGLGL